MRPGGLRRLLLVLLTPLLIGAASAQASWGVRIDVDLPIDQTVLEFVANPLAYAQAHRDVVDARAFLETGQVGVEGRYRSSTEAFLGAYYIFRSSQLLGQALESRLGLYAGRDFRADQWYLSLRGTLLLFGQLP